MAIERSRHLREQIDRERLVRELAIARRIQLSFLPEQCPTVGSVTLDQTSYQCNETVQIQVVDFSILGAGTQPVTIVSGAEPAGETVVLNEIPANSGSFVGSIPLTTAAASGGDGLLSITDGNTVTVTYIDADDGYGGRGCVHATSKPDVLRHGHPVERADAGEGRGRYRA